MYVLQTGLHTLQYTLQLENHNGSFQIESKLPTWSAAFHADRNRASPIMSRFVDNAWDIIFQKGAKRILKCAYKVCCKVCFKVWSKVCFEMCL